MQAKFIYIIGGIGAILVIVGLSGWLGILPKIVHDQIADQMYISESNNETYDIFVKIPIPIRFKIWVYQVDTNEFDGENVQTIKYSQKGPYVFNEKRLKTDLEFDDEQNTVSYKLEKKYEFNKKESCKDCNEDDYVTIYNLRHGIIQQLLDLYLQTGDPDWLALNYTEKLSSLALYGADGLLGRSLFGNPDESRIVVKTGKSDIDDILQIISYDDKKKLNYWNRALYAKDEETYCEGLEGTDGTQFKPGLSEDDIVWVFEPLLCIKLYAKNFNSESNDIYDLKTLRYWIDEENFQIDQKRRCYCWEANPNDCLTGLLNLKNCPTAKPVEALASPALFYDSIDNLKLTGLDKTIADLSEINRENYGAYLDIEPNTGMVLRARKLLTLSVKLRPGAVPALNNLTGNYQFVPIFTIEESATIDEEHADELKEKLLPKKIATGLLITIAVIGLLMICASIFLYFRNSR